MTSIAAARVWTDDAAHLLVVVLLTHIVAMALALHAGIDPPVVSRSFVGEASNADGGHCEGCFGARSHRPSVGHGRHCAIEPAPIVQSVLVKVASLYPFGIEPPLPMGSCGWSSPAGNPLKPPPKLQPFLQLFRF